MRTITVKELPFHTVMVLPLEEDPPLPAMTVTQEGKPTRTDPTLLIPGMILLEGMVVTEEVEEEEEEAAEEEEVGVEVETMGTPTLKTLAIPHGGICQRNGKSTIS